MANDQYELRGINHLALVCRDMKKTVDFYSGVLGMPLTKTINLPGGGQGAERRAWPSGRQTPWRAPPRPWRSLDAPHLEVRHGAD